MKLYTSLFLMTVMLGYGAYSQNNGVNYTTETFEQRNLRSNEILIGKAVPKGDIKGTTYLYDDWRPGEILLITNELIKHHEIMYNIENDEFELKIDEEGIVKKYDGFNVKSFKVRDGVREVKYTYNRDKTPEFSGALYEQLVEGDLELLKKTELYIKPPTYIPAKDMGDRSAHILKKHILYLKDKNQLIKLTKNNSWNLSLFPSEKQAQLKKFTKANKLNFKREEDLKKITAFYNTL